MKKIANDPFQGLMATPGGGFTMLGGDQDGNPLSQFDYSTLSPQQRAQLGTALEAYAPMANDTAEQHLPQVMQHHTTGRNVGGLAGLTLGGIAGGVGGKMLARGASPIGKLVAPAMGAVAAGLGGGYLGNRVGEGFDRRAAMPIAQENADFSHEMARNAAAERQRLEAAGQKTASQALAYSAGSADALAALGIEKEAFIQAVGAGLAAGARALAPHVGKAVQGIATAGRRLGTGLGQAWQAASPHMQQAGQQMKTMATNAYNTAKPVVQNAVTKVKNFASSGGVSGAAMESGIPGAISATNQKRMY